METEEIKNRTGTTGTRWRI